MTYNLWDTETHNIIGSYVRRADALAFVRNQVEDCGAESVEGWALLSQDSHRRSRAVAGGTDLLALAHKGSRPIPV